MLPPFKEAISKICRFLCFWKTACCCFVPGLSSSETNSVSPDEALLPQNGSRGRQVLVISHRELVPGEPPKTARVLRLLSKRRRAVNGRHQKNLNQNQTETIETAAEIPAQPTQEILTDPLKIEEKKVEENVVVQVTIENQVLMDRQQNTDDILL